MSTNATNLPMLELHGPVMPTGKKEDSFWKINLRAPFFSRDQRQVDYSPPIRTITLDMGETAKKKERWRVARLLSQHVLAGSTSESYGDKQWLSFHARIGKADVIISRDGSAFYTDRDERGKGFQHVVATPMLAEEEVWPDPGLSAITFPPCRLVQGTIPLQVIWEKIPWLGKDNPLHLKFLSAGHKQKCVKLTLAPDGILLDAEAPFPKTDGTSRYIAGRFLLAPTAAEGIELRLLPAQLDETQQKVWLEAWSQISPSGDTQAEAIPGFKVELRRGGLPPAFVWRLQVNGDAIEGFEKGIRVPGEDVLVRMLGPRGAETREGEARLQPETWVLSGERFAGALKATALKQASHAIWENVEADWGDITTTVEQWEGKPILTALLLPPPPTKPQDSSAPATALRIKVPSKDSLTVELIGHGGKEAAHALAHDETQLAVALRSAYGLPSRPPGQRDPERPLLAGFVPLSDGWLQVPIPNLPLPDPEKDNDLITSPVPVPPNVLAGFLRYGEVEKLPDVLSAFPPLGGGSAPMLELKRAPWLLTVESTQAIAVAIALGGADGPTEATAVLLGPELSTRGLLWLSADRPDELEALPRLGAGAGAYLDVPLESFDTEKEQALPVTLRRLQFVVERQDRDKPDIVTRKELGLDLRFNPSANSWWRLFEEEVKEPDWEKALKQGDWLRVLNDSYRALTGSKLPDLRKSSTVAVLPLVLWLRHPAMPLAALMPMTRSASSAVRPLESRDLIPLVVDAPAQADGGPPLALTWTLGGSSVFPAVGAGDTPKVKSAAAWPWPLNDIAGIPLAAFGVPGAELSVPFAIEAKLLSEFWSALNFALRFDLPALDEAFATASLPPAPEVKTPEATDVPALPIPLATALDWRAMGALWAHQRRRQHLARVRYSHLALYAAMGAGAQRPVRDLVGGATWSVELGFKPGQKTDALPYGEATIGAEQVAGNAALLGISGQVEVAWSIQLGASTAKPKLVGYAVPTIDEGQFLVDARGTGMGEITDGAVWRRKVFARSRDGDGGATSSAFELVTSPRELPVFTATGQPELRFWFKDLPLATKTEDHFLPADGLDPRAWDDGHLPRCGVEWRLWPADQGTAKAAFERGRDRFPFFGFGLEPLRLRQCNVKADGTPGPVKIRCRLHLGPRQGGPEAGGNLVDLSLAWDDGKNRFFITGLDPVQADGQAVKLVFALDCRESKDHSRHVEISTLVGWDNVEGAPIFSATEIVVGILGEDRRFKGATLTKASTPDGVVTLTKSGPKPPDKLLPGVGQMGMQLIKVETFTETVKRVAFPEIKITRWVVVLPAAEKRGGAEAPPAFCVLAESGRDVEFSAFDVPLRLAKGELHEEHGAISFTGTGGEPIEPFPGYGRKGRFSTGLIARVSEFDPDRCIGELMAGYLSGRWIEEKSGGTADCILLEAACQQRTGTDEPADFWSGALTLHLRLEVANAIRWPRLTSEPATRVPSPEKDDNGTELLTFDQQEKTGFSHKIAYTLDGHRLAFAVASQLAGKDDAEAVFSLPVMATHTLTPEDGQSPKFSFSAVETIAIGRAKSLIPEPAKEPNFDTDPIAFAARFKESKSPPPLNVPGMVGQGQGRISTVLSGALGHAFRAAFWDDQRDPKPSNRLALIGGFAGFIGKAGDLAAPDSTAMLIRLPALAVLGEKVDIGQTETTAEVAWGDGSAALPVALAWRAAATPASPALNSLRAALLAGIGAGFADADVESAILVEQSFGVNMDSPQKGVLAKTLFFPAAAVAVSRLMLSKDKPLPTNPVVLSLVAGLVVREVLGKRKPVPLAAALLTRTPPPEPAAVNTTGSKAAPGPGKAPSLLATLGEQVIIGEWTGPVDASDVSSTTLVAQRAFAEHAEPRGALLVKIHPTGRADYRRAVLPAPPSRARFHKGPTAIAFADPLRGFSMALDNDDRDWFRGWLRGAEEGHMAPFRDADPADTEPVEKSGLAGLSRRVSLPAQALPEGAARPVWTAEVRAPVYHPLRDIEGAVAPPVSWLAPGQPRPRLPVQPALEAAQRDLFGKKLPEVQWLLPAAETAASVGDRAGITLARMLRLETPIDVIPQFDYLFARFGRPAQGGSWSVRTERTPRPGPLPENKDDPAFNRRPCASRLEPRLPVEVLRGPADTIAGEPNPDGKFGAWVVKLVAAPDWDGMITDRFDGTVPVDVEIDVAQGSDPIENLPAADMLLRLLMPPPESANGKPDAPPKVLNVAALVVGEKVIPCQRLHFVKGVGQDFKLHCAGKNGAPAVYRGTLRIVLDPRLDQAEAVSGAPLKELAETLRAGFTAPPVELRFTVLPDSTRDPIVAPASTLNLTQTDPAKPEIPHGDSRPPVTLRLPLMPVVSSRGALPLPPNSLIFIDSTYDTDLGSAPARDDHRRVSSVRLRDPLRPLPVDRGDLFVTLYADRSRVNRRASVTFMIDFAFERPLAAAAQATAEASGLGVDGDFVRGKSTGNFELALAVTTRDGIRRDLRFGTPGSASSTPLPRIEFATVYELPLGLLLEADRTPARLEAGDMLELSVAETTYEETIENQTFRRLDVGRRVMPALWNASTMSPIELDGLSNAGDKELKKDEPLSRTVRVLLTDEPVVEPPPALYAALTLRTINGISETHHRLSLPLYAQSPLPWRVLLRDAKADFRRGYLRRAAVFIWNLARPAAELPGIGIHIVKSDRNGQTYLPPKEKIADCFRTTRRISS